jgi:Mrp family chromosome partitioning ATPase/uncharacterized protein involved in exopolysaccharide biosynthesis
MKNIKDDNELDFQSNSQYRQFVEHQTRSVARFDIVKHAVERMGAKADRFRVQGESERRLIERLQERLVVNPVADTYLMQVSVEGARADGLADLVNAVVESYLASMKEEQMFGADERMKNLDAREKELLGQVAEKTKRRTTIALELGVTSFKDGNGNPYDALLAETRSALAEARNARMAAEAKKGAFIAKGETDMSTRSINESVLTDPGLNSFKASLNSRRAALATAISGLTAQHPGEAAARQELLEIDRAIAQQTEVLTKDVKGSLVARYEMTLDQARRYETDLEKVLREQEKSSGRFAGLFNEALTLSNDITQLGKEVDAFRERLNFFAAERGALGFVRMVTPALAPEIPYGIGRKKLFILVLFAALLMALVTPVAIDLTDRRVNTVNDAESVLRMPSLGWMVEREGAATEMFAEDQLRRIAGGLIREQDRHGTRVFALSGVKPGGGTTELTLSLARTLNVLGFRTVAVEANAFHADSRYESDKPGLAQCLLGEATPEDCVVEANGELPCRVRVGSAPGRVNVDGLDRLASVMDGFSASYQFVLVDMPPLLVSADAEIMLSRLGQLLLVVEAGGISKGELARAGRLLEKVSSKAVGMIVNRIRPLSGGGYIRESLIEFLTQRKFSQFESQPAWRLQAQLLAPVLIEKLRSILGRIATKRKSK